MKKAHKTGINPIRAVRRIFRGRETNVYFISGMCYNCKVFDKINLPKGFRKQYIEWLVPRKGESLAQYALEMARDVDTRRPFVFVGYSFGAVVMQEMDKFLYPKKSVIISSFKSKDEIPSFFSALRRSKLTEYVPTRFFEQSQFITNAFNKLIYRAPSDEFSEYLTMTHPAYVKWAVEQITNWIPDSKTTNLYHIHGTEDQIFPFKQISNALPVEGGDHLMVVKKADVVSALLDSILLMKE